MCKETSIDLSAFWLEIRRSAVVRDSRQLFEDIGMWSPILMLGSALRGNPVRFRGGPAAVREDEGAARHWALMSGCAGRPLRRTNPEPEDLPFAGVRAHPRGRARRGLLCALQPMGAGSAGFLAAHGKESFSSPGLSAGGGA